MSKEIYLIEKVWVNTLGNTRCFGYSSCGYVYSKQDAEAIVRNNGKVSTLATWFLSHPEETPDWYRYTSLQFMDVNGMKK